MLYSQDSIRGKVYGAKAVAKYIKISNTKKNIRTFSDENGSFSLKASVGDSIVFSSSFYEKKLMVLDNDDFLETIVVQLKEKVSELDEVYLEEVPEKEFDITIYNEELSLLVENDVENKPWAYKPQADPRYGGVNLAGFIYLAKKFFSNKKKEKKKKKTERNPRLKIISFYDLVKLNTNDVFFNDTFFTKDLNIPKDYKHIFFEYFQDQKISSELLNEDKRLLLIEKFIELSPKFLNSLD